MTCAENSRSGRARDGLAGLALLNKLLVLVYAFGLLGGLLLGTERRQLTRPWI